MTHEPAIELGGIRSTESRSSAGEALRDDAQATPPYVNDELHAGRTRRQRNSDDEGHQPAALNESDSLLLKSAQSEIHALPEQFSSSKHAATSTSVRQISPHNDDEKSGLRRRNHNATHTSPTRSLLRSVGLKIVTSGNRIRRRPQQRATGEPPKVVESRSLILALTRTGAHILPVSATVFLICFNAIGFLNGPDISTAANFTLQLAAKFYELAVVGSLTVIVLEIIRYYLLREGITFGLVGAGATFSSLNFLWSPEFWGLFTSSVPRRVKIFVGSALILCCLLASTIGPASTLLFLPIQLWLPAASTEFYLGGTEDQLYPLRLTAEHGGPDICRQSPLPSYEQCLYAGFTKILPLMTTVGPVRPGWGVFLSGGSGTQVPPRIMTGMSPDQYKNYSVVAETWAMMPTVAMIAHLQVLGIANGAAWGYAKGRNRRLRDFVGGGGGYGIAEGKLPTVRTVCGNSRRIDNNTATLEFPVIERDKYWRDGLKTGPIQEVQIGDLASADDGDMFKRLNISHRQARAKWVTLPPSLGSSVSAGVIVTGQNDTTLVAQGCVVDARWAQGEYLNHFDSFLHSLDANPGKQPMSETSEFKFDRAQYLDERYKPYFGPTMNMTSEWFDSWILPMPEQAQIGSSYNQTNFEALLNTSAMNDPFYRLDQIDNSRINLEYYITMFLLDALSRVGFSLQTPTPTANGIKPELRTPGVTDDKFLNGGPIYDRPNFPHMTYHYRTFKYGTAWYFNGYSQWIALSVLLLHTVLALAHSILILWRRTSSEAWDSVAELMALAYNSNGDGEELENCAAGIISADTLKRTVMAAKSTDGKAQLVFLDEGSGGGEVDSGRGKDALWRRGLSHIFPGEALG
ncbi:uncharacterized protein EI97DRAFT_455902 [Westerdykella ornata]|uniref:Uncharacterized protein n=1 Tax=Westerdykella ornata TaxID=318751 RepID=A0A6A6JSV5_WESOR|nr:uncharacterized protein EI97DRAFT_455902 [Westerdykella ornata]KAF2279691.1 hypothetical protein EI97DRAFT_455902 [Westerdykella ornata]